MSVVAPATGFLDTFFPALLVPVDSFVLHADSPC
jgi:hypothetical protein